MTNLTGLCKQITSLLVFSGKHRIFDRKHRCRKSADDARVSVKRCQITRTVSAARFNSSTWAETIIPGWTGGCFWPTIINTKYTFVSFWENPFPPLCITNSEDETTCYSTLIISDFQFANNVHPQDVGHSPSHIFSFLWSPWPAVYNLSVSNWNNFIIT